MFVMRKLGVSWVSPYGEGHTYHSVEHQCMVILEL